MASVSITASPQAVSIPPGTPVFFSSPCLLSLTSAGGATGALVNGSFIWPGVFVNNGAVTLFVQVATVNAITLAATGVAAYNNNAFGVNATVTGGTVTGISISGTATGATSGTFFVAAGGTVAVTYSAAPTLTTAGVSTATLTYPS